jgi:putative ABC transport system ATP-binding protein
MNLGTSPIAQRPAVNCDNEVIAILQNVERVFSLGGQLVYALHGVNLTIHKGQFIVIMGRSGSGKTTLLNVLGGLDKPTKGQVFFRGKEISKLSERALTQWRRQEVNFIFQSFALLPTLTAYENTELPLRIKGIAGSQRRKRVKECLEMVGLWKRAHHRTFELSGGEQQRVGIARALATKPRLLLADEPTGELDSRTGHKVLTLFQDIIQQESITVCMVTHNPDAVSFANVVYHMADGKITS